MTPEEEVDGWNSKYEVGIRVTVKDDFGNITESNTRSVAWVLCGSAVVMYEGRAGGYLLERVKAV